MTRVATLIVVILFSAFIIVPVARAQTTEFTYQGQLQSSSALANGNYDFEFLLFPVLSGGTQIGSTLTLSSIPVTNGIFAVKLDFGSNYPGATRFLEIHVRQTGGGSFTPLTPRQSVSNTPYAVKSLNADTATTATTAGSATTAGTATTATNATQLGGVAAGQYVQTVDSRLSDARTPTAGSASYVQNTGALQATSQFNISGNGTAGGTFSGNIVNATTQYNIGGSRILGNVGTRNLFAGINAGQSNTGTDNAFFGTGAGSTNTGGSGNSFFGSNAGGLNTAGLNSFFGSSAGQNNTTAIRNSFFGVSAGANNTTGGDNSFIGAFAGQSNTTGFSNSFFGMDAGALNTTGNTNSFFGTSAGTSNTTGAANSFFGNFAGQSNTNGSGNAFVGASAGTHTTSGLDNTFIGSSAGQNNTLGQSNSVVGAQTGSANTTGSNNSFFGQGAGGTNTSGNNNTLIGAGADVGSPGLSNATAIGYGATVGQSNALILGSTNVNVGIGTSTPAHRLAISGGPSWTSSGWTGAVSFTNGAAISWGTDPAGSSFGIGQTGGGLYFIQSNSGPGSSASPASYPMVITDGSLVGIGTTAPNATLTVNGTASKPGGGSWTTFSDERLKNISGNFTPGLKALMKLQPIRYQYKADNALGLKASGEDFFGFGAQSVQKVIPEAVTKDSNGYLLINNDPIILTMLNAIKEQQGEILKLQHELLDQKGVVRALRLRVFANNRRNVTHKVK